MRQKLQSLYNALNMPRQFFAECLGLDIWILDEMEKKESLGAVMTENISHRFDVNPGWLTGEEEAPVLLSMRFVLSDAESIRTRLRELQGEMDEATFARLTNCPEASLTQVLHGEETLTYRMAKLIASGMDVSLEWLLYGDEVSRRYPVNREMLEYLKTQETSRQVVRVLMGQSVKEDLSPVSERLKKAVDQLGIGQEILACETKTPARDVEAYLHGTIRLPDTWLSKVCQAFFISEEWVRSGKGRMITGNVRTKEADRTDSGLRLKKFRIERKMTQKALAEILGISVAMVSLMETGRNHVPVHMAKSLEEQFGISSLWLLNGESE